MSVTLIRPAANPDAARWLLSTGVDWWDLVRYGPPGFEAYARVAFPQISETEDEEAAGPAADPVRTALSTLSAYTTTPTSGYAAIWEGWVSGDPAPKAPRIQVPHRTMLLFAGPVESLRDSPALAWYGAAVEVFQEPHLVWPEDRAWCLACEVDEEIEFTVGGSADALEGLARVLPGAVRPVQYGDPTQTYRDPA